VSEYYGSDLTVEESCKDTIFCCLCGFVAAQALEERKTGAAVAVRKSNKHDGSSILAWGGGLSLVAVGLEVIATGN
jgi:hypothetical protein